MARMTKGYTLLEMTVTLAIIAILAAVSIPNLITLQARAKQSEVKSNLKSAYVAEKAFFQEKDRYSSFVSDIGFAPERNNRYAYFFDTTVTLDNRSGTL